MATDNRRKHHRLDIALPVRVDGHDASGTPWTEMTKCADASEGGCSFRLRQPVFPGQVLVLQLPLPRRFRSYDLYKTSYQTFGLVHTTRLGTSGATRVGVAFLGKKAPAGYDKKPGGRFLPERRRGSRGALYLKVKLSKDGADERTVLENFSAGGARVMTGRAFKRGELLTIEDADGTFRSQAEVREVFTGEDGIRRINLKFL